MQLRKAVEKKMNIKVVELNVEVPDNDPYHKYHCKRCNLDFLVSQEFEDQSIIVCNSCKEDDQIEDKGEAILYKGVVIHG